MAVRATGTKAKPMVHPAVWMEQKRFSTTLRAVIMAQTVMSCRGISFFIKQNLPYLHAARRICAPRPCIYERTSYPTAGCGRGTARDGSLFVRRTTPRSAGTWTYRALLCHVTGLIIAPRRKNASPGAKKQVRPAGRTCFSVFRCLTRPWEPRRRPSQRRPSQRRPWRRQPCARRRPSERP